MATSRQQKGTLRTVFDPRLNGLNLVRLLLAAGVILRHSFTMVGTSSGIYPLETLLRSAFVDGFFAISGFLIVDSWIRKPHWRRFLRARCLRILPAFWTCLLVTALLFSPMSALLTGHPLTTAFWADSVSYVWKNWFLWIFQEGIDGTPQGGAGMEDGVWNGSLWTLAWEFICYLSVMALGLFGLLRRRFVAPLFLVALAVLLLGKPLLPHAYMLHHAGRFATMFLAGAVVYFWRDRIPVRLPLVGAAALVVFLSGWLPDYRAVSALPLAYLCIVGGAMIKVPALRLTNDISYGVYIYGYPVQQVLIGQGLAGLGVPGFFLASLILVTPLAIASWTWVERPSQKFRTPRRETTPSSSDSSSP